MKKLLSIILISCTLYSNATTFLEAIVADMRSVSPFCARINYFVTLPMTNDDVTYTVDLYSSNTPADSLSESEYLIDWTLTSSEQPAAGFSAYSDGSFYRLRDSRLQEYHFASDSISFLSERSAVQKSAQFVEFLPSSIATEITKAMNDSAYQIKFSPDKNFLGKKCNIVEVVETRRGYVSKETTYYFDATNSLPLKIEIESNPGTIGEQTASAEYDYNYSLSCVNDYSENALIERYPEAFAYYRQSNFRVENLPGTPLPSFSLQKPDKTRFSHNRGDSFVSDMILVFISPEESFAGETVTAVRTAVANFPANIDIVWAFDSNHEDIINEMIGTTSLPGETALTSVRGLMRDLGVVETPSFIFVNRQGIVCATYVGFNSALADILTSKLSFAL